MRQSLSNRMAAVGLIACALLAAPACASTIRPAQGNVIMAKWTATAALYVWNASPYVAGLVHDKLLGADGMQALEATAMTLLAQKAALIKTPNVSVRIVYEKTGAVSPVYGTPTFMGMENVATLSATRKAVVANGSAWAAQLAKGATPSGLTVTVSGKLPPPQ